MTRSTAVLAVTELPGADEEADEMENVVELAIVRFLNGDSDGGELFQALYGDALAEPIPEQMLALVRGKK